MSSILINQYYNQVNQVKRSGAANEGALSMPFFFLLMQYAQAKKHQFHSQITIKSKKTGKNIRPDGILMNDLRVHRGYWESKDPGDKLDEEIDKKLNKDGYPSNNIIFEDSQTIVLIQGGEEAMRGAIADPVKLHEILTAFMDYRPAEVLEFEAALEAFKKDIPEIAQTFRALFDGQSKTNARYAQARDRFLDLCKKEINPDVTEADVREMLIQHILTEDLFASIFDDASFLKYNIIARELEGLIDTVITRAVRQNQLGDIRHYYQTLNATAAQIADHNEKQKFLKTVYENFYKVYNPKGADRLGVVYTPNEIVRFMVESTDFLLEKHFGTFLHSKGVEILDPATGTGTFITDIIDYIAPQYLQYKFENELHANEVAILPYYIANLNIEYTYKNKMGSYAEFKNICFVDTLDNTDALAYKGKQHSLFGLSSENAARIRQQNERKISVIIGNPPYNSNQQNFNDFNKNREYPHIDARIKDTFVKQSTAQKSKVYDMYARFYRWAMDRVNENGIIAFITNSSFINSRTFDGFRKTVQENFEYAYIIDLGGNVRELSGKDGIFIGEAHTVFGLGAMVGIAMMFLVKKENNGDKRPCVIQYIHPCDIRATRHEKFDWLKFTPFRSIPFKNIVPSKKNDWVGLADTNFDSLLPLADKKNKNTLFDLCSNGVSTNRDEWVYDFDKNNLAHKMKYFSEAYNQSIRNQKIDERIKWSSSLSTSFGRKEKAKFNKSFILKSNYRPYTKLFFYADKIFNDRLTKNHYDFFGKKLSLSNIVICLNDSGHEMRVIVAKGISDLHFTGDTKCLPLYRYDSEGKRHDNLTDWGLSRFTEHYKDGGITKEAVFYYAYAVLHHPAYRQKYELNLKREFPRLPFYPDFSKWSAWGKELMDLHLGYETVDPYHLKRIDKKGPQSASEPLTQSKLKTKLKAEKETGIIYIDEETHLAGIPPIVWDYKLGNRSALEWVLDQYKEKKPTDQTIAENFDTYVFADYKEEVIDLLMRVCTVSVKTVEITNLMGEAF